ncbi:MAG: hypothetical protein J7M25_15195 [Deltaproteobacteria bacterium]|nr:hypothetical protein [Deltaproteobacteria bacterium]
MNVVPTDPTLAGLWAEFSERIREVFQKAREVDQPAGTTPGWARFCERYGVSALSDEERQEVLRAQNPTRGAAVMEFFDLVHRLCTDHRARVRQTCRGVDDDDVERQCRRLLNLVERTERELVDAYRRAVLPPRQGMFANVFAGASGASARPGPSSAALTCRHCGAPRLSVDDLECAYCGQKMI